MGGHNEQDYRQRSGLLEDVIIPLSRRLRQISYLKAIRESFCLMMPVIILLTLIHMTLVLWLQVPHLVFMYLVR